MLARQRVKRSQRPFSRELAEMVRYAVGYRSRAIVTFGNPIAVDGIDPESRREVLMQWQPLRMQSERPVVDGPLGVLLKQVVHHIAHTPIRTRGTFCGSIAHADPASEWCLLAATLGARMRARSVRGERLISEPGFFEGMMATALAPDELLLDTRC